MRRKPDSVQGFPQTRASGLFLRPSRVQWGGHPEWHVRGDALALIDGDCSFITQDGQIHQQKGEWDLLIAHPPCTFMSKAGARWMYPKSGQLDEKRLAKALEAKAFFMRFLNARCSRIAVENPQPLKIVGLPAPDCVVQPYHHGDPFSKKTLLWLKNLPPITPTCVLTEHRPYLPSNTSGFRKGQRYSRGVAKNAKESSKTFPGIALAMAIQWGNL